MKRLVLLGGGHAHVFVLDALAKNPMPGVEVSVIAPYHRQVYSGMLPGWISGHYPLDACMVPLSLLAERAGCRFLQTSGVNIDPQGRRVLCEDGNWLEYDTLSIDIGSTTDLSSIDGAASLALPVRPIETFIKGWENLLEEACTRGEMKLAVIGGGAAGIELALSMHERLSRELQCGKLAFSLISSTRELLPDHGKGVGKRLKALLKERQISLHLAARAVSMTQDGVLLSDGEFIPCHKAIVATGASAPSWLWQTGISLDEHGFIQVDEYLRTISHADIFAAGDVAAMVGHPRPKSGVYAVRGGPPLAENLRQALQGQPLKPHRPQKRALYLMSTGNRHAVGSWGPFSWEGDWVWRWKDRIDRRFMSRFRPAPTD